MKRPNVQIPKLLQHPNVQIPKVSTGICSHSPKDLFCAAYRINSAQNIQIIPLRTSENSGWNFFKFPCECRQIPVGVVYRTRTSRNWGRTSCVEGTDRAFTWFWLRSFCNLRFQLYVSACLTSLAIVLPAVQKNYLRHVVIVMLFESWQSCVQAFLNSCQALPCGRHGGGSCFEEAEAFRH